MNKSPNEDQAFFLSRSERIRACCIPKALFQVKDLSVHYGKESAVNKVNIDIFEGCTTAIVGPSGCGKSTFLQTLGGLISLFNGVRVKGSVQYAGNELYNDSKLRHFDRAKIGYIFQRPTPFARSIYKNMSIPLIESGIGNRAELAETIEKALQEVGLWEEIKDRLHRSALRLSGGQQQRLCLARALALRPEVLLMDEPTNSLDPQNTELIEEWIKGAAVEKTIVLVTHNLQQAKKLANYMAVFRSSVDSSTLIESGETNHLFNKAEHPFTQKFLLSA